MNPAYPEVASRAGHRCEYCHAPEVIFNFPFEVEHVIPIARGGSDALQNLALVPLPVLWFREGNPGC
jgi:hypothetical protein